MERTRTPIAADTIQETVAPPIPIAANEVVDIPLHGRIAAGVPIEALEGQNMLSVPAALLGSGEHYALEVAGDSMMEAGILDGDFALVQRTEVARDGQIVIALIDESEATLKYFRSEEHTSELHSLMLISYAVFCLKKKKTKTQ